jgi:hypothetical protein
MVGQIFLSINGGQKVLYSQCWAKTFLTISGGQKIFLTIIGGQKIFHTISGEAKLACSQRWQTLLLESVVGKRVKELNLNGLHLV